MSNVFVDFLQNKGLYDSISITNDNYTELYDIFDGKEKISLYCKQCRVERVFSMEPIKCAIMDESNPYITSLTSLLKRFPSKNDLNYTKIYIDAKRIHVDPTKGLAAQSNLICDLCFKCSMNETHHLNYVIRISEMKMMKIGQYPSIADISIPELRELESVIDKESINEFRRAIGLYSHGIGIGSFVYLRRIFERIISQAKKNAENNNVDLTDFDRLRMSEKIQLLKDFLPEMIVSRPEIYGIVSKGIHELNEGECKQYFPILKEAILITLSQWIQKRKEQDAIKRVEASISSISTNLSSDRKSQ